MAQQIAEGTMAGSTNHVKLRIPATAMDGEPGPQYLKKRTGSRNFRDMRMEREDTVPTPGYKG